MLKIAGTSPHSKLDKTWLASFKSNGHFADMLNTLPVLGGAALINDKK
jgi:hypothetical protein